MAAAIAARLKLTKRVAPTAAADPPKRPKVELPPAQAAAPPGPAAGAFAEGEAVLGNFKGLGDWDEAVVVGVQPGGLYTLDYTDEGLLEENVPASCIQRLGGGGAAPPAPAAGAFAEGEAVLGNFKGMGDWDEAVVVGVQPGGLYTLDYTDEGLIEENVPASCIMRQGGASATDVASALAADLLAAAPQGAASTVGLGASGATVAAAGEAESSEGGGSEEEDQDGARFIKSPAWCGARRGYVFKRGYLPDGSPAVGYFIDEPIHIKYEQEVREPTWKSGCLHRYLSSVYR